MPGWDDILKGSSADDILSGGDGDDFLQGRAGNDILDGGAGNDQIHGDTGNDHIKGGEGNDLITGGDGIDTAYYSGSVKEYSHYWDGENFYLSHVGGTRIDGNDWLKHVERLVFADAVIDLTANNAPIAYNDVAATHEDVGTYSSGPAGVLSNDFDWEGSALSVTPGTFTGTYGTLVLNADGTYTYTPFASTQSLAQGQTVQDSFSYTVSDGSLTDTGTLTISIAGLNDAPVANPDAATTSENAAIIIDVLANDTDVDNGAVLTVTAASAPAGRGTASVVGNQVRFDPGTDFDDLAEGESVVVQLSYMITDEFGATSSSTVDVTVTGTNDAPVANPDSATTGENDAVLIAVLANDTDVDNGAVLTVTSASAPVGQGTASVSGNQVEFDPGSDFDHLAEGTTEIVTVSYTIEDEHGASSSSTIAVTVTGTNDGPVANADTAATSENASILIDVLGNDDDVDDGAVLTVTAASAPAGQGTASVVGNQVQFDPGSDFDDLAVGDSEEVVVSYDIEDEHGASSSSTITITVTGTNDGPVANPDTDTTSENAAVLIDVLANDTDADDGAVLTVTSALAPVGQGTASVVGNQVHFDPGSDFDDLAVGDSEEVVVSYDIEDQHGASSSSTITITVTGTNDGPVANPDTDTTSENAVLLVDVLANDTDADDGAVLTVTAATAPAGQGTASVVGNQVQFDPGSDFDDLAVGHSEEVVVSYDIEDEHGATSSSTITIIVTGTNDGPVANPDTATTSENAAINIDVLANDTDADDEAVLSVTAATVGAGQGSVTIVEDHIRFDPGTDFDHLASGQSAEVVVSYTIEDEHGVQSSSTVTITVEGRNEGAANTGTNEGEELTGTDGDDTINALGGDDSVYGLAGDDTIDGGDGRDFLDGGDDNDAILGGTDNDVLLGGGGNDQLQGQAGNDTLVGGDGADDLSGGDGADFLSGDAGDDVLQGGNDDDYMTGGEGSDTLSGQAGSDSLAGESGNDTLSGGIGDDSLDGGEDDDTLDGGDGNDFLSDFDGINSLAGGLGLDTIIAGSSGGAQTIQGGDGDDTIRHYYRHAASTITTGAGRDTIELVHANLGTAAIIVTDFTAGAGGDMFALTGPDSSGALLSLLAGWDGSSNPFGSGFLRLTQDGTDTLLEWDQDGTGTGADWQTLVVFQNTDADDFTDANFVPGFHPNGSAPAGETITGTAEDDTLTGTIGDDTISGLGGNDFVNAGPGADIVNGGDGSDFLRGEADNDVVDGGNDDDFLWGGDGDDTLSGQAGSDSLVGESGGDTLTGGAGDDSLDGGDGDDSLDGGDGNDFLSGGLGVNQLTGGLGHDHVIADSTDGAQTIQSGGGDDTIRHYYRHAASTITTGAGRDTIELAHANLGAAAIIVTDFTTGAGGDMVQLLGDDGALLKLLSGWDGNSNPFSAGFLRLTQDGADTRLEWDQDGAGTGADWETLIVFQNKNAVDFTDANFLPGYDPGGGAPAGETITGTADDDKLEGTIGDDVIDALAGNDFVYAGPGADIVRGGDGSDYLRGEGDDDVVEGGNDDDFLWGGDGSDTLSGQAGSDSLIGEAGDDTLSGGIGNDGLDGGDGADTLSGGDGDDFLIGGLGADLLTGGAGSDAFYFQSAADGADAVTDFVRGTDRIGISAGGFGGGLFAGGGVSLVSGSNPIATATSGQFLYDTDDGRLLWDEDGIGIGDAVLIATFSNAPPLTASDFIVLF